MERAQTATEPVQPASDPCSSAALPSAPPPKAAMPASQPASTSGDTRAHPVPVKHPHADSAPSSPRIAACAAASLTQSSNKTAARLSSLDQQPAVTRSKQRLAPAHATQDTPSARHSPSAADAAPTSDARYSGTVGPADAAAAAPAAAVAATASAATEAPATAGALGVQLSALLPAERHKPGSNLLTSSQFQGRPQSPPPDRSPAVQPVPAAVLGPAVSAAQHPQPDAAAPPIAGLPPGREQVAAPSVCRLLPEDNTYRTPSAAEHHPVVDLTSEDKMKGTLAAQPDSYGLAGAPLKKADLVRRLSSVFMMSTSCVQSLCWRVSAALLDCSPSWSHRPACAASLLAKGSMFCSCSV